MMLRDSVCGTVTYDPDLRLRPEKKRKVDDIPSQHYLEYKSKLNIPIQQSQYSSTSTVDNSNAPSSNNFFESPEALKLFNPKSDEPNAMIAVENQIAILKRAQMTSKGYHHLFPANAERVFTEYEVFIIRQKIVLLTLALNNAKQFMPQITWKQCCDMAVETGQSIGISVSGYSRTVMKWYAKFKVSRLLELPYLADKHKLPPFLLHNREVVTNINQYAREHINELSAQLILEYLHEVIIPELVREVPNPENKSADQLTTELLHEYGLSKLSLETVTRWMNRLGFKYDVRKKSFYVDGHERQSTITYRNDFVKRYLSYELRAHRWIQITKQEHDELVDKGWFHS